MDLFYVRWCDRGKQELIHKGIRRFYYDGPVWCHLVGDKEKDDFEVVGSWRELSMSDYKKLLKRTRHLDMKQLMGDPYFGPFADSPEEVKAFGRRMIRDPYKYGQRGAMSTDHLEVFIEGKYCARIR
jgi:hypothetical protein